MAVVVPAPAVSSFVRTAAALKRSSLRATAWRGRLRRARGGAAVATCPRELRSLAVRQPLPGRGYALRAEAALP
ncbi:hypothetical protein NDU88_000134 [Pleurodeles waltl]|uniref:Uncharacterized protein n=1 Tax=Pleurodeles waltl TaxID=8319 RepID=A0AAV7VSL4_PLEWA|nr:hypothetical protein NDU88_000134 [Pleurodeles waltl]